MQTHTVDIDWLTDTHECDDCGLSAATGATITIDGKEAVTLMPSAYCFNSDTWEHYMVLGVVLGEMGIRTLLEYEGCCPEDISRGRSSDGLPALADEAPVAHITMSSLRDDDLDDYSRGYRITLDGNVIADRQPELIGRDASLYLTPEDALITLAEHCGARFTPGSLPAWMRNETR